MTGLDRARRMGQRLMREMERAGLSQEANGSVVAAYHRSMDLRQTRFPGERHPGYLHPARTVLILLRDVEERDPDTLAAAAITDTWWEEAEPHDVGPVGGAGAGAMALRSALPRPRADGLDAVGGHESAGDHPAAERGGPEPAGEDPDGDQVFTEALVLADTKVRRLALAERLDHLRHLHLLGPADGLDRDRAVLEHRRASTVYLPVAARTDEVLERRYQHWCRVFQRRLRQGNPHGRVG